MLRLSLAKLELRGMGGGLPLGGICPDFCRMVGKKQPPDPSQAHCSCFTGVLVGCPGLGTWQTLAHTLGPLIHSRWKARPVSL